MYNIDDKIYDVLISLGFENISDTKNLDFYISSYESKSKEWFNLMYDFKMLRSGNLLIKESVDYSIHIYNSVFLGDYVTISMECFLYEDLVKKEELIEMLVPFIRDNKLNGILDNE